MVCRTPIPHAPDGVSPKIAAIWTEYFQACAWGERDGATDDDIAAAGKEMEAAARRLAITPHQSLEDIAAKAQFVIYVEAEGGRLSTAESDVRASVLAAVLAMATASVE